MVEEGCHHQRGVEGEEKKERGKKKGEGGE
jgi:hypothetical protein